jgi:hypothetical protein
MLLDSLPAKAGSAATGLLAFFKAVPWPDVAGFVSVVWVLLQAGYFIYQRIKERK